MKSLKRKIEKKYKEITKLAVISCCMSSKLLQVSRFADKIIKELSMSDANCRKPSEVHSFCRFEIYR